MKCPKCRDCEMGEEVFEGITIDRCPTCRGIFLDHAELSMVLRAKLGAVVDAISLADAQEVRDEAEATCGRCDAKMTSVRLKDGLRIERCGRCLGLFLDEGELATLQLGRD
jgi:Zn-finger nucleic acid-binding protein